VVVAVQYQGALTRVSIDVEGTLVNVAVPASQPTGRPGERVTLSWGPKALHTLESA
jgi:hypothetical protein